MSPDDSPKAQPRRNAPLPSSRRLGAGALLACVFALLGLFSFPPAGLALALLTVLLAGLSLRGIGRARLSDDGRQLAWATLCVGVVLLAGSLVQSLVLLPPDVPLWGPLDAIRDTAIGTPPPP